MTLEYIDTDDLPLAGPDPYDPSDKQDAGEAAEQKLEADVNDGQQFTSAGVLHEQAIAAWATYTLATGPNHPTDAKSGDFYNGSAEDQAEFAAEMKNIYQSNRESILGSEADDSSDDTDIMLSI
jgi:hypothetical protein